MYEVKLDTFEGPMDLLLFLIRKNEVDIYDIPIAQITKEYLQYIELMQVLNLEIAGEFIVMAATLMRVKAKMLLPAQIDDEEEEDPRQSLILQLLEYKKFKELSGQIKDMEANRRQFHTRRYFKFPEALTPTTNSTEELLKDVTVFDLIACFQKAVQNAPKQINVHQIERLHMSVEDQMSWLIEQLEHFERHSFLDLLVKLTTKIEKVVTFIALLELIRFRRVVVRQNETLGDIWIFKPEIVG